jgi:hypothetical protein
VLVAVNPVEPDHKVDTRDRTCLHARVRILRAFVWIEGRFKRRWRFVAVLLISIYLVVAAIGWWAYPSASERQIGSRAFDSFVLPLLALLAGFIIWGLVTVLARGIDRRS